MHINSRNYSSELLSVKELRDDGYDVDVANIDDSNSCAFITINNYSHNLIKKNGIWTLPE